MSLTSVAPGRLSPAKNWEGEFGAKDGPVELRIRYASGVKQVIVSVFYPKEALDPKGYEQGWDLMKKVKAKLDSDGLDNYNYSHGGTGGEYFSHYTFQL